MGGPPSPISPLPVSRMSAEEMKSPPPPPPSSARLRSLRRLLSRGKQAMGSSCSPRGATSSRVPSEERPRRGRRGRRRARVRVRIRVSGEEEGRGSGEKDGIFIPEKHNNITISMCMLMRGF
uniref:Uncharacterized protein n=1 Tax=Ananas comosus var. bracteatus TaxID=296719 RepID=A0A6V7P3U2_ANACO|nr:unnamed protein product [Ananas comosus var. bracteatus]